MGVFWVPGHSGIRGNEIAEELAREDSVHCFVRPEPALRVSRQSIKKKIQCWLYKQHMTLWQGRTGTQGHARELISGPGIAAKTRLLSFNRTQCRVVTDVTGHNTLRRRLHIITLTVPCVGGVEQRRRPQLFCVSVKPWRHSAPLIWVPSFWTLRTSEV